MSENEAFDGNAQGSQDDNSGREDPLHGPQATNRMKKVPPMPLGDGTYYRPGYVYEHGASYVDALGNPAAPPNLNGSRATRFALELDEWVTAANEGPEALRALEAKRQKERLKASGIAKTHQDADVCAGGKCRRDCIPAQVLVGQASDTTFGLVVKQTAAAIWAVLTQPVLCDDCGLLCVASAQFREGMATGIVCVMNTQPSD